MICAKIKADTNTNHVINLSIKANTDINIITYISEFREGRIRGCVCSPSSAVTYMRQSRVITGD